ncbi:MAG: hypothetical protein P1P82_02445 [Bacteroidales bacterium]|nr:hypothetical protein [Bacteroidales bacterium]MDT8431096.1 hypothetical protein [Bacteroidales bacterium]
MFFASALFFTSCEKDPFQGGTDTGILPEKFSVDIPDAISQDVTLKKSLAVDTLKGNHVYSHLRFFIRVGESAGEIVEGIIRAISVYDIDRIKTLSYESAEDGRIKNVVVVEAPEYEDQLWDYGLTLTDAESEVNEDGGKGLQIFWNENPRAGVALLKPYNINRKDDALLGEAMFRVDYSEAGEFGYDAHMIVSIADLPAIDPLLEPFAMNAMKMFVGKKADKVDVYGNSSHPNAKLLTTTTGYNWAFVASAETGRDVAAAEVGLPLSTLDATGREVLLEEYSIKHVFTNEVLTVWSNASQERLNAWLTNTEAPGYFDGNGFVQGGTMPGEAYTEVSERLLGLSPYNPKSIANLEILFN